MDNENNQHTVIRPSREAAFESAEYRMGSGRFVIEMFYRFAAPWMLALMVCAVAGIVVGLTVDIRWLIVALMVVFVVAPMLMAFLYYYFGLRREAFVNTVPHRISISPEGVEVTMIFEQERVEVFRFDELAPLKIGLNSATAPIKRPARGFLWIPMSAFDSDDEFIAAIQTLDYHIHLHNNLPLPFDIDSVEPITPIDNPTA